MADRTIHNDALPEEKKRALLEAGATLFDPEALDVAIVDVGRGGNAIYDYWRLVAAFAQLHDSGIEEAQEWVDYNTLRSLPYIPEATRPEIRGLEEDEE
jgi:hypothetical protein